MILLNSIYIYFIYRAATLGKFILNILKLLFFCIQLADRFLADFAIFYEDFSWKCKAVLSSVLDGRIGIFFAIRHSHPADMDASSIFCFEALRSVIVKTIIPQMIRG